MLARIQFQHVRYFLALAAERNFTRAAKRCGVSQPSLTNAIKSLELSLGGPLFERGSRGCHLTEFGKSLRPHFERLQSGADEIGRIARRFQAAHDPQAAGRVSRAASGKQPIAYARSGARAARSAGTVAAPL